MCHHGASTSGPATCHAVTADADIRLARYFGLSERRLPWPPGRPRSDGAAVRKSRASSRRSSRGRREVGRFDPSVDLHGDARMMASRPRPWGRGCGSAGSRDGGAGRRAPAVGDPRRRHGRLQPADGGRRGRHARPPAHAPAGADRPRDRQEQGPDHQDHRRRHAGRVPERHRGGAVRGRGAGAHGAPQRRRRPGALDPVPHRHQSRRRDRRRRRHPGRRRQRRRPARDHGRARRHLRLGGRARPGRHTTRACLHRSRRAGGQEHRAADPRLRHRARQRSHRHHTAPSRHRGLHRRQALDRRPALHQHERRPRAGVLRRRPDRGPHHRAVALPRPPGDLAQLGLRPQGQAGARAGRGARVRASSTWSRAACARPATGSASPSS